ncbi:MAG: GTPase, partial [Candidatus Hydrothermia bacterium]
VHHEPGTTRDYISESVELGGYLIRLYDSAGTGEFGSSVDREAVNRSLELARNADIVIYLLEPGSGAGYPDGENIIKVCSKSDLLRGQPPAGIIPVSGITGKGLEVLIAKITTMAEGIAGGEDALLERERQLLAEACVRLEEAGREGLGLELVAENLWSAGRAMDRLLGLDLPQDVIRGIFSRFCLGK